MVDYALRRPEVDGHLLAAYGISYGGYILPRAVSGKRRIRATAACSVLSDLHAWMTQTPLAERSAGHLDTPLVRVYLRARTLEPSSWLPRP